MYDALEQMCWEAQFESFTNSAAMLSDTAMEGTLDAPDVTRPTSEYERLKMSGLLAKVDELKEEVKQFRKAVRKNHNTVDKSIKDEGTRLIKALQDVKTEINKINSDPIVEKKRSKSTARFNIITYVFITVMFCWSIIMPIASITGIVQTVKDLKWIEAKKYTIKTIDKLISEIQKRINQ